MGSRGRSVDLGTGRFFWGFRNVVRGASLKVSGILHWLSFDEIEPNRVLFKKINYYTFSLIYSASISSNTLKCFSLAVTSVNLYSFAVAAIIASGSPVLYKGYTLHFMHYLSSSLLDILAVVQLWNINT